MPSDNMPSQFPNPQSDVGNQWAKSLRTNPQTTVRKPDGGSPPTVKAITGFGTGQAGAFIGKNGADADKNQGVVELIVGTVPSGSGTIVLNFPAGIADGQYLFFADWGVLAPQPVAAGTITINWTATLPAIPGARLRMAYQLAVSN